GGGGGGEIGDDGGQGGLWREGGENMRRPRRPEAPGGPNFLKGLKDTADAGARMDEDAIKSAYRRWAPVYDRTFGRVAAEGRKHSVEIINQRRGRVLAVGVGPGLSLPPHALPLHTVSTTPSPPML